MLEVSESMLLMRSEKLSTLLARLICDFSISPILISDSRKVVKVVFSGISNTLKSAWSIMFFSR